MRYAAWIGYIVCWITGICVFAASIPNLPISGFIGALLLSASGGAAVSIATYPRGGR